MVQVEHCADTSRNCRSLGLNRLDLPLFPVSFRGRTRLKGSVWRFLPPLFHSDEVTEMLTVSTGNAKAMARSLARDEAIFAGTSTGANVVAALEVAKRLGPNHTVVTIIVDLGLRYVSTDVYRTS